MMAIEKDLEVYEVIKDKRAEQGSILKECEAIREICLAGKTPGLDPSTMDSCLGEAVNHINRIISNILINGKDVVIR